MTLLNSSDLAKALNVSPGRVSQYVSESKLDGCFTGDGRARRFDLDKVCMALGRRLHPGQMLGNGSDTRRAIATLKQDRPEADDDDPPARVPAPRDGSPLAGSDPARYEMARTQKAEEEARRLRRQNAEAEGTFVLASEVERQVARLIAQEIAEFEAVLRDGSRKVADKMGVDFKVVRQLMMDQWRAHRGARTKVLSDEAEAAEVSADERDKDI
jgi:hypothetical protein